MTDLMGSLTTELRITGRIFRETAMGLKRTGWMNVIIVVTMASILSIFGVVMAILIEMSVLIQNVGTELEISAYVQDNADAHQAEQRLQDLPHIKKMTLISKEKAWEDMQKDYPLPDIENPLPDTIHLQMTDVKYIPETVDKLRQVPEIAEVQYAQKVLEKIRKFTQWSSLVGVTVSFILGFLTLFIISNTIHLLIQNKSREIEILRMMGVGNWYIRLPFYFQGAAYGLSGALASYGLLYFAVFYINQLFAFLGFPTNELTLNFVFVILILMGVLVGAGGAAVAIRKYLQV